VKAEKIQNVYFTERLLEIGTDVDLVVGVNGNFLKGEK